MQAHSARRGGPRSRARQRTGHRRRHALRAWHRRPLERQPYGAHPGADEGPGDAAGGLGRVGRRQQLEHLDLGVDVRQRRRLRRARQPGRHVLPLVASAVALHDARVPRSDLRVAVRARQEAGAPRIASTRSRLPHLAGTRRRPARRTTASRCSCSSSSSRCRPRASAQSRPSRSPRPSAGPPPTPSSSTTCRSCCACSSTRWRPS